MSGIRRFWRCMLPSGPSIPRFLAPLPSLSSSDTSHSSVVPSAAANSNVGTPAQFCPKSTTRCSPGLTIISSPAANSFFITTLPYSSSLAPSTSCQVYALTGERAKSLRKYISAPAVGKISPANSVFISGVESSSGVSYPGLTRASYTSPSNIAACFTGPAIPAFHATVSVPNSAFVPSS